jgi:hypothetical protein
MRGTLLVNVPRMFGAAGEQGAAINLKRQ